jgi:DNA gyrase/topoisomerase IV subunit B
MNSTRTARVPDIVATAVRALMLYSLAEFQSGHATTIRVTAAGTSFGITDDGRGHSIARVVDGASYLKFIYTQFDYPFESAVGAPIQLQGIGMSLINAMCGELALTVRNPGEMLELLFRDGQLVRTNRTKTISSETGNTISAKISPQLQKSDADTTQIEAWLLGVLDSSRSLKLFFNGRELQPH